MDWVEIFRIRLCWDSLEMTKFWVTNYHGKGVHLKRQNFWLAIWQWVTLQKSH